MEFVSNTLPCMNLRVSIMEIILWMSDVATSGIHSLLLISIPRRICPSSYHMLRTTFFVLYCNNLIIIPHEVQISNS